MASKRRLRREAVRKGNLDELTMLSKKCHSKQPFPTRDEAEYNMERLKASVFWDGRELNVYRCPLSSEAKQHYHFGHL